MLRASIEMRFVSCSLQSKRKADRSSLERGQSRYFVSRMDANRTRSPQL